METGEAANICWRALDQSLQRMGLDYVDIFYPHRMDPETPLEETMGALAQAVKSGKALYAGISNYDGATMKRAAALMEELHCPFIINQNRYSIFDRTIERNGLKQAAQGGRKRNYRVQSAGAGTSDRTLSTWNPSRQPCKYRRPFPEKRTDYGRKNSADSEIERNCRTERGKPCSDGIEMGIKR